MMSGGICSPLLTSFGEHFAHTNVHGEVTLCASNSCVFYGVFDTSL